MMSMEEGAEEDHTVMNEFELIYPRIGSKILVEEEPAGRSGHSMVPDESNLYVFGGYNPLGRILNQGQPTVLDELWKFNFATEKWIRIVTVGCTNTCASSCLVMQGAKLYVFGGTSYPFGQRNGNEVYVCNLARNINVRGSSSIKTNTSSQSSSLSSCSPSHAESGTSGEESDREAIYRWDRLSDDSADDDDNKPPKGYGQSIIFHDHYMYTFGGAVGFYSEAIGDLYRLDLESMTWEKMSPRGELPEGRYKQEIIRDTDNQGFLVMGGGRLHTAMPVHLLYHYSFPDNLWTKVPTAPDPAFGSPKPRSAFGFVQVDRDVYVCGGSLYGVNSQPHQVLQDVWHLSLRTLQWTQLSVSLPEPVYFHRAAVSPSKHLYVYGGVVDGGRRSTKMYRYRLPFQVAPLSETCWVAVCRAWSRRGEGEGVGGEDRRELVETYGIPRKFVQRLS